MRNNSQFELVESVALTRSGFEVRVNVARFSSARDNEITITNGCASFAEFDQEITRLVDALEEIRTQGETRFADGPFGPKSIL